MRSSPKDDQRQAPPPLLLAQPWSAGVTGWIVVLGAIIAELAGGAVVANQMSTAIAGTDRSGSGGIRLRRSRIAAWAAIPAALAGCQLATYFLNQFVLYYHIGS